MLEGWGEMIKGMVLSFSGWVIVAGLKRPKDATEGAIYILLVNRYNAHRVITQIGVGGPRT